jgi:hypothetical protein
MTIKINGMISTSDFVAEIEEMVYQTDAEYIDAIVEYCSKNNIEIETAAAIIRTTPTLKSKIQMEAEDLNVLPKTARLPVS